MGWETGQKPVIRSFQDFSNIARARANATLRVDSATGHVRVTDRENPFQRMITWVRDKLGRRSQPPSAQTRTEEVRGAYNRFLKAVAEERRYQDQLRWLEDALAPDIMVDDPKPLTTRRIRDLTERLEGRTPGGAETRTVADYFSGRAGSNGLKHMLEDRIAAWPLLEAADFELAEHELDKLSAAIHDAIMAKFHTGRQEVSQQQARRIAAGLVDETLAGYGGAPPASRSPSAATEVRADVTTGTTARDAGESPAGATTPPGASQDAGEALAGATVLPDAPPGTPSDLPPGYREHSAPDRLPGAGGNTAATRAATGAPDPAQPGAGNTDAEQPPGRTGVSAPLRRSFVRNTIKQLRGRGKTFAAPLPRAAEDRPEAGSAATGAAPRPAGKPGEKYRERAVDVAPTPAAPEPAGNQGAGAKRRPSMRLGGARRSTRLADSVRPSVRKDGGKQPEVIDQQRLSDYLKDIELPRDVRAAVKRLVRDGSVRNYRELFGAVNEATFEWACKNRMWNWYGEALKGQDIPLPRGKNKVLPPDLLEQLRSNVVNDGEALDYPNFKRQVRLMVGKYVLGQPL